MTKTIRVGRALVLGVALLCAAAPLVARAQAEAPRLRVSGEGAVEVVPDTAWLFLGVQADARRAEAALGDAGARMSGVIDALEAAGIGRADIQTSALNLNPVYPDRSEGQPPSDPTYRAVADLSVRIRVLEALGEVMDAVAEAGGNRVSGLRFDLAEPKVPGDAARTEAVIDARRKAALYAAAAGMTLGPVLEIIEGGAGSGPRPMMDAAMRSMPVAEGTMTITASVEMVFGLQQPAPARP